MVSFLSTETFYSTSTFELFLFKCHRPGSKKQDSNIFPCINDWQKDQTDPSTKAHLIKMLLLCLPLDEGHKPHSQRSDSHPGKASFYP